MARRLRMNPFSLIILLVSASLTAQTSAIRGPVSGFVHDGSTRAVRPVIGIPGAAYLGPAVASGVDFASVAPDGRRALVLSGGTLYFVRGLRSGELRWRILEQRTSADRAAWSPDSRAVAVWSAAAQRLRLWRGLGDEVPGARRRVTRGTQFRSSRAGSPVAPQLDDLGVIDGEVTAMAVGANGDVFFATPGGLYEARENALASLIAQIDEPAAIAAAESALFVADRARGEILEIRYSKGAPDVRLFAGPGRGIDDPTALAVIDGGRTLVVAEAEPRRLMFFDTASRDLTGQLQVVIRPTRLVSLTQRLFLLNSRTSASDTLYVLDSSGPPTVYFIPAGSAAENPAIPVEE